MPTREGEWSPNSESPEASAAEKLSDLEARKAVLMTISEILEGK